MIIYIEKLTMTNKKQIVTFGIGLIIILSIAAILQMRADRDILGKSLFIIGTIILGLLIIVPGALVPLYRSMLFISKPIGFVVTSIILTIIWYAFVFKNQVCFDFDIYIFWQSSN